MDVLVTCDGCDAVSEAGWGDNPYCLDCSPADEICEEHQRTFVGNCPLCCEYCGCPDSVHEGEDTEFTARHCYNHHLPCTEEQWG